MTENVVPFRIEGVTLDASGLMTSVTTGTVRVEPEALVIEFSERQARADRVGTGVLILGGHGASRAREGANGLAPSTVRIPLEHIAGVELKGGLLRAPRLRIELSRLATAQQVPWADGTWITLPLRRRNRGRARELLVDARLRISDLLLHRLDSDLIP